MRITRKSFFFSIPVSYLSFGKETLREALGSYLGTSQLSLAARFEAVGGCMAGDKRLGGGRERDLAEEGRCNKWGTKWDVAELCGAKLMDRNTIKR